MLDPIDEIVAVRVLEALGDERPITMASCRQALAGLDQNDPLVAKANLYEVFWIAKLWDSRGRRRQQLVNR